MDALTLLEQQHREVEALAQEFVDLGPEAVQRKKEIAREVIEKLSIHATLEEMAFYPVIEEAIPELADDIAQDRRDHQSVKELAQKLLGQDPEDPRFSTTIITLVGEVEEHVGQEEGDLFPKVRDAFTAEELDELGDTLQDLHDDAARRPHPWAPDQPPLNTLAVPIASRLDKLRSAIRDRVGKDTV